MSGPTTQRSLGLVAASAAAPPAAQARSLATAIALRLLPFALAVAAVPVYVRLSWSQAPNADDANTVLQGVDIAHGNLLLHGWTLSGSPFYLVELPVFAVVAAVRGTSPAVVHEAPAIIYAGFLLLAGLLAAAGLARPAAWTAGGLTVGVLMAPFGFAAHFLLLGPYHLGTAAAILASLLAIQAWKGWRRDLAVLLILTASSVSDPLTVWVGSAGIAGVLLLRQLRSRSADEMLLLITVTASALLAQAALRAIRLLGGFTTLPLQAGLAPRAHIVRNAQYAWDGLRLLFGAAPSVPALPDAWLGLHLVLLGLCLAAAGGAALSALRGRLHLVEEIALAVIGLDVAAMVVSGQTFDISSLRYLMPAYGLLAVVAGRRLGSLASKPRPARVGAALAGLVVAAQLVFLAAADLPQPPAASPRAAIAAYLEANGLKHGLGQYWDASSITLDTHGAIVVRAVYAGGGEVLPYHWESSAAWYEPGADGPATFVLEPLDGTGPGEASVIQAFGPPARQVLFAGYRVDIWTRDLAPLLKS